jgi:hypothetical protein
LGEFTSDAIAEKTEAVYRRVLVEQ